MLLLIRELGNLIPDNKLDVFIVQTEAKLENIKYANLLRENGFSVYQIFGDAKLKTQFKKADQSVARFALIVGENEIKQ